MKPSELHRRNELKQLHGSTNPSDIKAHMKGGFFSCWLNTAKNQQDLLKIDATSLNYTGGCISSLYFYY